MAKAKVEKKSSINSGVLLVDHDCLTVYEKPGFKFIEFQCVTECKFSLIDPIEGYSVEGFTSRPLFAGVKFRANVSRFKLDSGCVIAYFNVLVDEKSNSEQSVDEKLSI